MLFSKPLPTPGRVVHLRILDGARKKLSSLPGVTTHPDALAFPLGRRFELRGFLSVLSWAALSMR